MNDESCKVPREDLDGGFNPCRRQVVENGELCQYAHMYDVMNERYDREEDTSYLNSVKRDRISQSTPSQSTGGGKIYSQDTNGVEGFISTSGTLEPTTNAEIPSSKAVADYVADYAPIPLPISKGGTGGNTPYRTDSFDNSATFVMYDEPNGCYNAAPMSSLSGYLDNRYSALVPTNHLSDGADLDGLEYGTYYTSNNNASNSLINGPDHTFQSSVRVEQFANGAVTDTKAQVISENLTGTTFYRSCVKDVWYPWTQLYPTTAASVPNPLPVDQGGTGAQTRSLKTAAGLTLLPVIDSIGASGALNGYTSVTNIATFITTNNIRPEITKAFENHIANAVANNDLLPTNALMMDYVDGRLVNYNSIIVSGGGTSKLVYNRVRLKNNRIYGDCGFTVNSEGDGGGVKVYIKIKGTDMNIPPVSTKFILSNKPMLVHKSSNTIIEGKNICDITNGAVYIQFNLGDFNTGEFIFIVDSVFTGYN